MLLDLTTDPENLPPEGKSVPVIRVMFETPLNFHVLWGFQSLLKLFLKFSEGFFVFFTALSLLQCATVTLRVIESFKSFNVYL